MVEIQDIIKKYGKEYKEKHKIKPHIAKAMGAIEKCRTAELGGHIEKCGECGYEKISYNSCRNRHCPKCQSIAREKWIYKREQDLLNVKYFHVVFTIPSEIYLIAKQNEEKVYKILFKAVAETLEELGKDKKIFRSRNRIYGSATYMGTNASISSTYTCNSTSRRNR